MKKLIYSIALLLAANVSIGQTAYWLNFSDAVQFQFGLGNFSTPPLWEDSTVVLTAPDGLSTFNWWIHGAGAILDPGTDFFNDWIGSPGLFTAAKSYRVRQYYSR